MQGCRCGLEGVSLFVSCPTSVASEGGDKSTENALGLSTYMSILYVNNICSCRHKS